MDLFEVISNKKIFDYCFVFWLKVEIKYRENVFIIIWWYIYIIWKFGYSDMFYLFEIYCLGRLFLVKYVVWVMWNFLEYMVGFLNV